MIRAKQLSNLSSSARSFFWNGSRYAADGSCTTSEDENYVSRRQHARNENLPAPGPSTLTQGDSVKVVSSVKAVGFDHSASRAQQVPVPGSVSYSLGNNGVENDGNGSTPIADQFVRAGIVAAGFLSDLVNYKIPSLDGGAIMNTPTNSVIESPSTITSVKSSNVKHIRREHFVKVNPKPSAKTSGSNTSNNYNGIKDKGTKSNFVGGSKRGSDSGVTNSSGTHNAYSESYEKKRPVPEKYRSHSNRFSSNFNYNIHSSDAKFAECVTEGFIKPSKTKISSYGARFPKQYNGSGHIVESASHILRQMKWCPAAEAALGNLSCSIDAYQANQVLKQIQDYTVALEFFYWLKQQPRFKHDEHTYTTMVGILGRARQFGAINKLLDQMVKDGCQPNVVTYNRIIHSYGRANYLKEAINVFNQMQDEGCEPDRVTYCTLIDIHAKAGYLDIAMGIYQRMQAAGLSPDTFTYSVMINCLGKAGHLPAAQKLFFEMIDQGCVPNLVTYNIMIALQFKARNYQSALKIYRDMENSGFEPDKVTYSIVMEVLGHCGYLDEAEAVFEQMKRNNWVPDEPVYGLLIDLWGKAGNVEKAWHWYQTMLHAGLRPNVPTCNSLLSAFLRVHRLSDAYNLLQSMLVLGLNPSLQTYTLLLSCCTEAQTSYDMSFCCELMATTGHPAHKFLQSMPAAGPDGQNVRDHVSNFLDLMHSEDREGKRGLVDAVVDFLHKSGLKEEAGSVWEVAAQKNVYPDAVKEKDSCYWLINLHVMSDGTAVTALSRSLAWIRQQMLVSGVTPSRVDIVTGWGRRSRVTGSSLVRQAVQELLSIFSFPFFTENGNSGCFIGYGEPLNRWLLQSYVERMHLL